MKQFIAQIIKTHGIFVSQHVFFRRLMLMVETLSSAKLSDLAFNEGNQFFNWVHDISQAFP